MKALPLVAATALAFTAIAPLSSPAASDPVSSPSATAQAFPVAAAPTVAPTVAPTMAPGSRALSADASLQATSLGSTRVDVLARDASGALWLYRGNGSGGWISPRLQVGSGWTGMSAILGPGDFSGDGKVDVLARDGAGRLWLYRGNGSGGWISPRLQVGSGWTSMSAILGPGDFSGDGNVDVLARDGGTLWLYRGNGAGRWISPPLQLGTGWDGMTAILGPGDFSGDGGGASVDCSRASCVALTFDDGPSAHTDRLITTLTTLDVPATFFVVGSQVVNRPTTTLRLQRNGLPVENQTYSHAQLDLLSLSAQRSEVDRCDDALAGVGVARSTLLRPPYGSWNSDTRLLGKPLILWSVDPRDWDGKTASQIRSAVVANTTSGSIVLMHDSVSATVDAVPGIVSDLRARGFTLVTVATLVPWMEPGDLVYSRGRVLSATTALLPERAPAVLDEAPFPAAASLPSATPSATPSSAPSDAPSPTQSPSRAKSK